jgi:hypothetical protein
MGDSKDLLVNEIGPYDGYQLVVGGQSVMFDITADGAWTVEFIPIHVQVGAAFEGRGDNVSGLFDPPSTGAWVFRHDGSSNFAVWLNCAGGTDLIQNEIGPVDASGVVQFARGPCLWQVTADGSWSLAPRQ